MIARFKNTGMALFVSLFLVTGCGEKVSEVEGQPGELRPQSAHASEGPQELKFQAPAGWISETPSSSMRKGQYRLPRAEGDPEDAEMAVFFFPGQGGSVQANIDRWIAQFHKADGSPAGDTAKIHKRESHGIPLSIVDVSGTYLSASGPMLSETISKQGFRMLAVVAETPNGPWFFKLTGPARTIAKWEESFNRFLETIQ